MVFILASVSRATFKRRLGFRNDAFGLTEVFLYIFSLFFVLYFYERIGTLL